MIDRLQEILWFVLPAACANISASVSAKIVPPSWNYPLDCYSSFFGKRIFGNHKTWRGLVFGVIAGGAVFFAQQHLFAAPAIFKNAQWFLGFVLGAGAVLGDAFKSFFKRRFGIAPGSLWFPFDYIDWVLGALIIALPFISLSRVLVFGALIATIVLHPTLKHISYRLGIDKKPL